MAEVDNSDLRQRKKPSAKLERAEATTIEQSTQSTRPEAFVLPLGLVFSNLLVLHYAAALNHPIQDCDETFNYLEPLHFLTHGYGFQTWEYAPAYAIRSWAYIGLHAVSTFIGKQLSFIKPDLEFYLLRIVLAASCAACETHLFRKIAATFNQRVAATFMLIMGFSPGIFHASVAFLPSSFAMYTTTLGLAAFMDWRGGLRTAQGIFAVGIGAVLGWPFAAAMAIPFLLEELALASIGDSESRTSLFRRVLDGTVRTLLVLALQVAIDSFFFKKLTVVPVNIIWYNVFSAKGGPNLYGTEPWHFYFRNLFLNFNGWFILALLSMPLMIAQRFFGVKARITASRLRGFVFLTPFYLWLLIFTLQPHKEERFMYPAYPALALNASVAFFIIFSTLQSTDRQAFIGRIPQRLRAAAAISFVLICCVFSVLRTIGTIKAYNAPLSIYKPLHDSDLAHPSDTVCLGKEWYRFPSHYLLPRDVRAKFIKSEFTGLLPGEFHEGSAGSGFGLFPGTWLEPPGMNDENREDPNKYTRLKYCNFLVDLQLPSTQVSELEPNYIADTESWERVKCLPFMDSASTGWLGRLIWIPDLPMIPQKYRRVYGDYCLLKRRRKATSKLDAIPHIELVG